MANTNTPAAVKRVFAEENATAQSTNPAINLQQIQDKQDENARSLSPQLLAALIGGSDSELSLRLLRILISRSSEFASADRHLVSETITDVIQRPDEITQLLELYWADGRSPLSQQLKLGLEGAFRKFNATQLAEGDTHSTIRLRDVMRLIHPKPLYPEQELLWRQLIKGTLSISASTVSAQCSQDKDNNGN